MQNKFQPLIAVLKAIPAETMKAFAKLTQIVKVALGVESIIVPKVFHPIAIAAHHRRVMQVFTYLLINGIRLGN